MKASQSLFHCSLIISLQLVFLSSLLLSTSACIPKRPPPTAELQGYSGAPLPAQETAIVKLGESEWVQFEGYSIIDADPKMYGQVALRPGTYKIKWGRKFGFSMLVKSSIAEVYDWETSIELLAGHRYTLRVNRTFGSHFKVYFWIEDLTKHKIVAGAPNPMEPFKPYKPDSGLNVEASIVIATPADGNYKTINYPRSGMKTANALKDAFADYAENITIEESCATINCLKNKYPNAFEYYIVPEILHWEDRASKLSGKPDQVVIELAIYLRESWDKIALARIVGPYKGPFSGYNHPEELLPEPLSNYAATLYHVVKTKGND